MSDKPKIRVERDWIDYANLALNVDQSIQLGSLNSTLSSIERQSAQENERASREDRMRNFVFHIESSIETLERAEMGPISMFERGGVQQDAFRSFEDKDRLKRLERRIYELWKTYAEQFQRATGMRSCSAKNICPSKRRLSSASC
jgi:hypothetical protein